MEKYLVPKQSGKKSNTREDTGDVDNARSVKKSTKTERVVDDEYYKKRYAIDGFFFRVARASAHLDTWYVRSSSRVNFASYRKRIFSPILKIEYYDLD